nr:acetyl-CoA hydrolase/transferase C-terminal domain-containing protein [Syntrophomonas wolfei]
MDIKKEYARKLISATEAAKLVKSGDWVDYGLCLGEPVDVDIALAARAEELKDVRFRSCVTMRMPSVMGVPNAGEHFGWDSFHYSGADRKVNEKVGNGCYIPIRLSEIPRFFRENLVGGVVIFQVAPMDEHGYFSLGPQTSWLGAILDASKLVIFEVNKNMPRVIGGTEDKLHISEIDYVVEGSNSPLPTLPASEPNEVDKKVARLIVDEIPNGACLQLGIGGMPNAVGAMIADSDLKDLGIHSELYCDAFLDMTLAGKINGSKKNLDKGIAVYTFAMGRKELYDFLDNNPSCAGMPGDYVNDPYVISQIDSFMGINNAVEVDLYGQACSETDGFRQISGTGGQLDFVLGTYRSKGGKSFLCISSTYGKPGEEKSRIVPYFKPGTVITVPRTVNQYVVTEYGLANLKGRSAYERAELLIGIAHPKFRDQLIKDAQAQGIWRRTNKIPE